MVLNDLDSAVPLPFDLCGWTLERPSAEEVEAFRAILATFFSASVFFGTIVGSPYEATKSGGDADGVLHSWDLPALQWRYAVVREKGPQLDRVALTQALRISDGNIWVALWPNPRQLDPQRPSNAVFVPGGNPHDVWQYFSTAMNAMPEKPDLLEIREVVELRSNLDGARYPEVVRSLALFLEIDILPERTKQKFLAYFSVIESLLTHAPQPNDSVDTLTRQLKRNIIVLSNRLPPSRSLGIAMFKNGTDRVSPPTVVSQLYGYRSAAAHGDDTEKYLKWFSRNKPDTWSADTDAEVHSFVRRLTKRLLIAAMTEPQLVVDLKSA